MDIANTGPGVDLLVAINGGVVTTPQVVLGQRPGPVAAYRCGTDIKRQVLVSNQYKAANPWDWAILEKVVDGVKNWSFLANSAAFTAAKDAARKKGLSASVIALVTEEQASQAKSGLPRHVAIHMLHRPAFITFVGKIEPSASNLAAGQR